MTPIMAADVETGAQPDQELLRLYDHLEMPGEFDPAAVDVGRATKKETIEAKIAQARAAHALMLQDWEGYLERHQAEWLVATREKAALDPTTGMVLAIGYMRAGDDSPWVLASGDEAEDLVSWWRLCDVADPDFYDCRVVFHHGFGFDLPFLVRRSWILGVPVPDWVVSTRGSRTFFNQDIFLDTMTSWGMDGRSMVKLDTLARAFGVEGKLKGCSGAEFARMFRGTPVERELALNYLRQDVQITLKVAQLMGME